MRVRLHAVVLIAAFLLPGVLPAQAPAPAPAPIVTPLAPGVTYRHLQTTAPAGEPWSIHILELSRKQKSLELRAVAGTDKDGAMQRELPTALAARVAAAGVDVVAVVNGDYDLPAPYLGISDGLSITSGELWTTGKPAWPNFALLKSREPVIAVPEVALTLSAGKKKWPVAALNKPFGSAWGEGLRLFTRQFRDSAKSDNPFSAVVIGKLSRPLPLRVNTTVKGVVLEVLESTKEVQVPSDAVVLVQRAAANSTDAPMASLRKGTAVRIDARVRMAGKKGVRHAVGGFPIVVRNGRRDIVGTPGANLKLRHPRTAACYNAEKIIFVVVDGRQPQLSVGMTLEELGDLMASLGCTVAMNTDGGGSSVMAVRTEVGGSKSDVGKTQSDLTGSRTLRIVNSPSDGRERGRGNAWVIIRKH